MCVASAWDGWSKYERSQSLCCTSHLEELGWRSNLKIKSDYLQYSGYSWPKYFNYFLAFSPSLKDKPKSKEAEKLNPFVMPRPAKKGGPGFADICLNKFPNYM